MIQVLKSNKLEVEEVRLWQSMLPWVLKQCQEQKVEDTVENKRKILENIIPLIRFPVMQMSDLVQSVSPTGLLPQADLLKLFTWLAKKGTDAEDGDEEKLGFICTPRRGTLKLWGLSSTYKSQNVTLSDKNTIASNTTTANYSYIVADTGGIFKKGKHAWRTSVRSLNTSNQWLLVGIGQFKLYTYNSSYNDNTVYGITSCNNVYRAGVASSVGGGTISLRTGDIIDCLYDADGHKLQFVTNTGQTCMIDNIPEPYGDYAPHYILYLNNSIKVEPIDPKKFGKF